MSALYESSVEHFERALLRTRITGIACVAATLLLIAWVHLTVDSSFLRLAFAGAIVVLQASAFLAGNTLRLRDVRTRTGNRLRNVPGATEELMALPPRETILRRLRFAAGGTLTSAVALAAIVVVPGIRGDEGVSVGRLVLAALLTLACGLLTLAAGTFTRPLD
jgi:hypothetical protein